MSLRRLAVTTVAVAAIARVLLVVAATPAQTWAALSAPQHLVDTAGVDAAVLPLAGGLAWLAWGWGALGLALTAASALPGALGTAASAAQRLLVPAVGRRTAALVLGVGMGLGGPVAAFAAPTDPDAGHAAGLPDVDWPAASPAGGSPAAPDWPDASASHPHVVAPGDCLWRIAADRLAERTGARPADGEIAGAVDGWWARNRGVVGPDPDLIVPGQVLQPPGPG